MTMSSRAHDAITATLALTLLMCAACAKTTTVPFGAEGNVVHLRVNNRGYAEVTVYQAAGGTPDRLGRVGGLQMAELIVRYQSPAGGPIRLLLKAIGSGETYTPEPIWARAGETVELTIQPLLTTSQMIVR
jgi:hypothetical protein